MESSARGVLLMVTDTGCGMEEATKARIFDPFFTTKVLGRGLGLSAVLGILRSCSASIHVDSRAGEGATFRLLFPAAESKSAQAVPESRRPEAARRGTVLVVEDEDMVRSFASAALKRAGYKVLLAAQGQEAVELIRANGRVDVVLLDVTMPVMSGRETFTQIKQLRPDTVVIVTSGHGVQDAERLMELQGDEAKFLQKPYTVDGLVQFVNAALPK
jgi:CheY-like chemotaxis protein